MKRNEFEKLCRNFSRENTPKLIKEQPQTNKPVLFFRRPELLASACLIFIVVSVAVFFVNNGMISTKKSMSTAQNSLTSANEDPVTSPGTSKNLQDSTTVTQVTTIGKGQTSTKFGHATQAVVTTAKVDKQFQKFLDGIKGFVLDIKNPWNGAVPGSKVYTSEYSAEKTVEQKFGVSINQTGLITNYNQAVTSSLASNEPIGDVLKCQSLDFYNYYTKNYFARLNAPMSVSRVTFQEPWYNQGAKALFNIDDKQVAWLSGKNDPYVIVYNKTMLNAAGLKDPCELVAAKQWTYDKLKEYSIKLKSASRSGLESPSPEDFMISLIDSNGGKLYRIDNTGKLFTNYNNSVSKSGMQLFYDWAKEKTVVFPTGNRDQAYLNFAAKKTAMLHTTGSYRSYMPGTFNDEVGLVVFPKGPSVANYTNHTKIQYVDFIPNTYQNDAAKILFLRNELYRYNYSYWQGDFSEDGGKGLVKNSLSYQMYSNLVFGTGGYPSGMDAVSLLFPSDRDMSYSKMAEMMVGSSPVPPSQVLSQNGPKLDSVIQNTWQKYKFTGLAGK
ncbi:MAG: hypothetical protein BGN88_12755 [Clostridiales bacterium 43-6]|nr:MAG: hypothetical protein BGN88_12755 [Clostridiales bacterium 43-6]